MRLKPSTNASFRFFLGVGLFAVGAYDLLVILLKSIYLTWPGTERFVALFCQIPFVPTVWNMVPGIYLLPLERIFLILLNVQGSLGVIMILFGLWNVTYARNEFTLIGKASEIKRLRMLTGPEAPPEIKAEIRAGGDVTWTGVNIGNNNNDAMPEPWWKRGEGVLILSVLAIVIAACITKGFGLTP